MKRESKKFIKNMALATATSMLTGVLVSREMGEITENGKLIGTIATLSQYVSWFGAFLPLHASDNRGTYTTYGGKFDKKQFVKDNLKFGTGFLILDAAYILTRPFVQNYLIRKGVEPENSSWMADTLYLPIYTIASIGIAKVSGIIRDSKTGLEKNLLD